MTREYSLTVRIRKRLQDFVCASVLIRLVKAAQSQLKMLQIVPDDGSQLRVIPCFDKGNLTRIRIFLKKSRTLTAFDVLRKWGKSTKRIAPTITSKTSMGIDMRLRTMAKRREGQKPKENEA